MVLLKRPNNDAGGDVPSSVTEQQGLAANDTGPGRYENERRRRIFVRTAVVAVDGKRLCWSRE